MAAADFINTFNFYFYFTFSQVSTLNAIIVENVYRFLQKAYCQRILFKVCSWIDWLFYGSEKHQKVNCGRTINIPTEKRSSDTKVNSFCDYDHFYLLRATLMGLAATQINHGSRHWWKHILKRWKDLYKMC